MVEHGRLVNMDVVGAHTRMVCGGVMFGEVPPKFLRTVELQRRGSFMRGGDYLVLIFFQGRSKHQAAHIELQVGGMVMGCILTYRRTKESLLFE
jgi:hypothetical protein